MPAIGSRTAMAPRQGDIEGFGKTLRCAAGRPVAIVERRRPGAHRDGIGIDRFGVTATFDDRRLTQVLFVKDDERLPMFGVRPYIGLSVCGAGQVGEPSRMA